MRGVGCRAGCSCRAGRRLLCGAQAVVRGPGCRVGRRLSCGA